VVDANDRATASERVSGKNARKLLVFEANYRIKKMLRFSGKKSFFGGFGFLSFFWFFYLFFG
jgi:hypothetical protein